jgi:AcrR family transcriptional regulator
MLDREAKVAEIVEAAVAQLRRGGYRALSVASLARELGLSPNSIYWYFPSKDDLLIAGVREIVAQLLAAKPPAGEALESRVVWFVEQLGGLDHLRAELYQRARASPAVARFVAELEGGQHQMLANALSGHVPEEEIDLVCEALLATIEGALLRDLDRAQSRTVIAFALRRFTHAPTPP